MTQACRSRMVAHCWVNVRASEPIIARRLPVVESLKTALSHLLLEDAAARTVETLELAIPVVAARETLVSTILVAVAAREILLMVVLVATILTCRLSNIQRKLTGIVLKEATLKRQGGVHRRQPRQVERACRCKRNPQRATMPALPSNAQPMRSTGSARSSRSGMDMCETFILQSHSTTFLRLSLARDKSASLSSVRHRNVVWRSSAECAWNHGSIAALRRSALSICVGYARLGLLNLQQGS